MVLGENPVLRGRMLGASRGWVSPRHKEDKQKQRLNDARSKLCPNSPFWHKDFDLVKHKQEWEAGRARHEEMEMEHELKLAAERMCLRSYTPPRTREAFDGKQFDEGYSPVLCQDTIFCPSWEKIKLNVAPWPSRAEAKYEGDDRISTDRLHRRFLGLPRMEGNETVSWQHRALIEQFPFDDFYYPVPDDVDVFLRTHQIPELEFSNEEGEAAISKEFMQLLDPQDQW